MPGFIRNAPNPLLAERDFKITSEYSRPQWMLLALVWAMLLPLCVPLAVLWMLAEWTFRLSGILTFMICHRLFAGKVGGGDPAFTRQWARAYINNSIGTKLPHWNGPFRRFLFRLTGITIGRGGFIGMSGYMEDYHPENVVIEDGVTVSFGVTFIAHGAKRDKSNAEKHIILRQGCYVGAASVILPCVEIGSGAVVGAGSVVTKDVPPGAVVAGSPARVIRWKDGFGPDAQSQQEKG